MLFGTIRCLVLEFFVDSSVHYVKRLRKNIFHSIVVLNFNFYYKFLSVYFVEQMLVYKRAGLRGGGRGRYHTNKRHQRQPQPQHESVSNY